jgi:hypothetical protein
MKTRTPLIIAIIVALLVIVCLLFFLPAPLSTFADGLQNNFGKVGGLLLTLAEIVATILIIILGAVLIWHVWRLSRVAHLVVDPFTNASDCDDLDRIAGGLNQLTREGLATALTEISEETEQPGNGGRKQRRAGSMFLLPRTADRNPVPEAADPTQLNNLLASLKDAAGANTTVQTAVELLSLVFTPRGTKIATILQARGETADRIQLGLSFEVQDLRSNIPSVLSTFWEPDTANGAGRQTGQSIPVATASAASATSTTETPTQPIGNGNRGRKAKVKVEQEALAGQEAADSTGAPDLYEREKRYLALVPPATGWLAVEVTRRSILANEASPAFYWRWLNGYLSGQHKLSSRDYTRRHHTLLTNYVGYLYLVCSQRYDRFPTFYRQAIDHFQQASALNEKWYKPYENLGDTWTMWGLQAMVQTQPGTTTKILTDTPPDSSKTHFYQALDAYSEAWRRFHTHNDVYRQPVVRRNGAAIPDDTTIERRLNLGICTARLLLNDAACRDDAINGLRHLRGGNWDFTSESDSYLLYNLACWYAIADCWHLSLPDDVTAPDKNAGIAARRYLVYSLARNRALWQYPAQDPCFAALFPADRAAQGWEQLAFILLQQNSERKLRGEPDLSLLTGEAFEKAALTILHSVWPDGGGE